MTELSDTGLDVEILRVLGRQLRHLCRKGHVELSGVAKVELRWVGTVPGILAGPCRERVDEIHLEGLQNAMTSSI